MARSKSTPNRGIGTTGPKAGDLRKGSTKSSGKSK